MISGFLCIRISLNFRPWLWCIGRYLLQIAGGIWADTVGGKQVLGFGVVWWSIATILTPVAAKLGLPFLLVARAFMGVGEVRIVKCSKKILSWIIFILFWTSLQFPFCWQNKSSATSVPKYMILLTKSQKLRKLAVEVLNLLTIDIFLQVYPLGARISVCFHSIIYYGCRKRCKIGKLVKKLLMQLKIWTRKNLKDFYLGIYTLIKQKMKCSLLRSILSLILVMIWFI